jgi:hypothetical protein
VERQPIPSQAGLIRRATIDPQREHRAALERQDDVVQQLAVAKYALTVGDIERAMAAIDAALGTARRTLSDLLDMVAEPDSASYGGRLMRSSPATSTPAGQPTSEVDQPLS